MFFKVWESCRSYEIIWVITVRVMRCLVYQSLAPSLSICPVSFSSSLVSLLLPFLSLLNPIPLSSSFLWYIDSSIFISLMRAPRELLELRWSQRQAMKQPTWSPFQQQLSVDKIQTNVRFYKRPSEWRITGSCQPRKNVVLAKVTKIFI